MRIAVVGAGGVGGYFGGLLAQQGQEVTFIARGAHLDAIRRNGLQVKSVNGDFTVKPALATADPGEVGPVDYVILGIKHYHLPETAPQLKALVGKGTTVVPLLNGVDAHEILIEHLGSAAVTGGLCSLVSMIESPGVIYQPSRLRRVVVGEMDGRKSERLERLVALWSAAGADAVHTDDIQAALWTKFLFIASFGGVTSLARANAGELLGSPDTRRLFIDAMQEVYELALALGVRLPEDAVGNALAMTLKFEPTATSSMQRDVAAGKRFELEAFSGKIVRLGQSAGISTPVHRAVYALLRPALLRAQAQG